MPRQTTLNGFFTFTRDEQQIATAIAKPQSPTDETEKWNERKKSGSAYDEKFICDGLCGRWRIRIHNETR